MIYKFQSFTKKSFVIIPKFRSFQNFKRRKLDFQVFLSSSVVVDGKPLVELWFLLLVAGRSVVLSFRTFQSYDQVR